MKHGRFRGRSMHRREPDGTPSDPLPTRAEITDEELAFLLACRAAPSAASLDRIDAEAERLLVLLNIIDECSRRGDCALDTADELTVAERVA